MEKFLAKNFYRQYLMMVDWVNLYLNALSDEDFKLELSPGKNHGVWILGHMITSDDDFSLYQGKGSFLFPEYQEMFGQGSKLQPVTNYPEVSKLREQWKQVCEKNKKVYVVLKDEEFDEEPDNMSEEMKKIFPTKGSVAMAWQLHQMYHCGQIGVLTSIAGKKVL